AAIPNARVPLHRAVRCRESGRPRRAAVVRVRDEAVPRAFEIYILMIAASSRAEEHDRRTISIARCRGREGRVVDAPTYANVNRLLPVIAAVMAGRYEDVCVVRVAAGDCARVGEVN